LIDSLKRRGERFYSIVTKGNEIEEDVKDFHEKGLRATAGLTIGGLREVLFNPKDTCGCLVGFAEYKAKHPATVAVATKGTE
jgi:hypothetical protein